MDDAPLEVAACSTCDAPIVWVQTEKRKAMPVDAKPDKAGKFVIVSHVAGPRGMTPLVRYTKTTDAPDEAHYTSHFATCPDRDQHRKGR